MLRFKATLWRRVRQITTRYPITRGMLSYAIIWPASSIIQEYLEFGTTLPNADWARALRFSIFGGLFIGPGWYAWMRFTSMIYPDKNLSTAIQRAVIDQVTYGPAALAFFFFGMSAMEMKSYNECLDEVKTKFWNTYKLGAVYWPSMQTVNFYLVPEKYQMVFVSVASCIWTVYMAHVKGQTGKSELLQK